MSMTETKTLPPYSSKKSHEQAFPEEHLDTKFHAYLAVLGKRRKIFLGSIMCTLFFALIVNATQKPVYQSSTEVVLQPKESDASISEAQATSIMQDPTFLLTQIRLIRGPLLAERVLKKLEKPETKKSLLGCFSVRTSGRSSKESVFSDNERRALVNSIRHSVSVVQVERGARILSILAMGYDPVMVKQVVDAAAESYVELNYELQIESFKKSFSVISKSLSEIQEKIKTGEIALQKVSKEIELLEALKVYGERHPLVITLRYEISTLAEKLSRESKNLERMEIGQRKDRFSLLTKPHIDMQSLSPIEEDLQSFKPILDQEVHTNRDMYNSIFKKLQEVELSGGRNVWLDVKTIEPAAVPGRPIRPNKKLNILLGLVGGLFLGAGLAFFLEYLDSSLRNLDDVRSYLKVFPLGMVPEVEADLVHGEKRTSLGLDELESTRSFWNTSDAALPLYVSEAYRIIRTNLAFGSVDRSLKMIQVTSAVKGEGKTTTVCNLGISLAQAGIKTLLVDADMRRPALHTILDLGENEEGLSNALTNGDSWRAFVRPTVVTNLFCMTGGVIPPNPAELLSSKRMKALLNELKDNFDMVILDSPPVISVADSAVIASCVDGIILVSRSGFIPRHISLNAKNALESVNGNIVGCILNCVKSHHQSYYNNKYYGYESRYGYHGEPKRKNASPKAEGKLGNVFARFSALKEPLLVSLMSVWTQFTHLLKWERRPKNETKSIDDKA